MVICSLAYFEKSSFRMSLSFLLMMLYSLVPSSLSLINSIVSIPEMVLARFSIFSFSPSMVSLIMVSFFTLFSKFSGVSIVINFPWFKMITFLHSLLTSDKMWELKIMVWFFPKFLITSRI